MHGHLKLKEIVTNKLCDPQKFTHQIHGGHDGGQPQALVVVSGSVVVVRSPPPSKSSSFVVVVPGVTVVIGVTVVGGVDVGPLQSGHHGAQGFNSGGFCQLQLGATVQDLSNQKVHLLGFSLTLKTVPQAQGLASADQTPTAVGAHCQ